MYEIELKAHVYNREEVIKILNQKAVYGGHNEKKDTYYHLNNISCRIRTEVLEKSGQKTSTNLFTYKRKEVRENQDGTRIEVNDENEFTFDNKKTLEIFLKDAGAQISLTKEKSVEDWSMNINSQEAHIELCTVPPLGDFLEIEIIKPENDEETVKNCRQTIQQIFTMCNIPLSQIEERYYRDLLKETAKNAENKL